MATPSSRRTPASDSCGHDYDMDTLVPMDLQAAVDILHEGERELDKIQFAIRRLPLLNVESSQAGKKRKAEPQRASRSELVQNASQLIDTDKWLGKRAMNEIFVQNKQEYARKWDFPDGVYQKMLGIWPEYDAEIHQDREQHRYIFDIEDNVLDQQERMRRLAETLDRMEFVAKMDTKSNKKAKTEW